MSGVSVGQVENLEDLLHGLLSMREDLECACREQIAIAGQKNEEAQEELQNSEGLLEETIQNELVANSAVEKALETLDNCQSALNAAQSALSDCDSQTDDEDGGSSDCSDEESDVSDAEDDLEQAQEELEQSQAKSELARENHQVMEQRVECAKQAVALAEQLLEQSQAECATRFDAVSQSVDVANARLSAAQQALNAYIATNSPTAQFHSWLHWNPAQNGNPVTPDTLRDRMNLSGDQRILHQEYLYERNPAYRRLVDQYRSEWSEAKGDAERNIVARKARIHLSGEFGEQLALHALAPLGARVETQGRTFVGGNGRYTKTDLLVTDLRVPVILGRGDGMGASAGGSMAFEVKCGKAEYLFSQKDHMVFQAQGHKQANAQCTLCSRDIQELSPEKMKELREILRGAGSPLVGMLPRKNEIDQSCLEFIHQEKEEK